MEKYNYYEAVKADIISYFKDNDIRVENYKDRESMEEELNEELWVDDSVTGNASGSYTFSTWEAEENLCHNLDLLAEALEEFGQTDINVLDKGAEYCDVTIRCYLLGSCLSDALDDLEAGILC